MRKLVFGLCAGQAAGVSMLVPVPPAHATLEPPKKGAVTHNDRGKWMVAETEKRKAKQVDVAWLKDYVTPK